MEASKIDKPYPDWRNAVDQHLHENYCITIEDAGIDEAYLINQWQSNQAPFDFVEWFGGKYDLDGSHRLPKHTSKTDSASQYVGGGGRATGLD